MLPASTPLPKTSRSNRRGGILWYCIGLVLAPACLLALSFPVGTTRWFPDHCYRALMQSGYSVRLQHADCEVVIYGDSSTMTALDPAVIQQITGLKTCNIAEGTTITEVVGTHYPLDQYLAHNKRPRFLLLMYTPSMYTPNVPPFRYYFVEGMTYAFTYERTPLFFKGLLRRPWWVLKYSLSVGEQVINYFVGRYVLRNHHLDADTRAQRDSHNGLWAFPLPPETHCVRGLLPDGFEQRHADQVAAIRQRYETGGTTVLFNISPVPDCDRDYPLYSRLSSGLHQNSFERLPISYFNEGDVHFSPQGSRYISVELGHEVLAVEQRQDAARRAASAVAP